MYFSLKPKNLIVATEDLGLHFFNDKNFRTNITDASGYQIEFFHSNSKKWLPFGHANFYYKFKEQEAFLDCVDLYLYKQPEYVDADLTISMLTENLLTFDDHYEIYDYYQDKIHELNLNNKDSITGQLSASFNAAYEIYQDVVDQLSGSKSIKDVKKAIKDLSPIFQNMLITDHIYVSFSGPNPDKVLCQELIEVAYENIERSNIKDKDLLLFKIMLGSKIFYSYLFRSLPKNFYISKYSQKLGTIQDNTREISQIMLTEFVAACTLSLIDGSEPMARAIAEQAEKDSTLFSPEIANMFTRYTTGDLNEAFDRYFELEAPNKVLRKLYDKIVGSRSGVISFRKSLITTTEGLTLDRKLRLNSSSLIGIINLRSPFQISLISSLMLLTGFFYIVFSTKSSLEGSPETLYTSFSINGDFIIGFIVLTGLLIFPEIWLLIAGIKWLVNKARNTSTAQKNKWIIVSSIGSLILIPAFLIYSLIIGLAFFSLVKDSGIYAITSDKIVLGVESTQFSDMEYFKIEDHRCNDCENLQGVFKVDGEEEEFRLPYQDHSDLCKQIEILSTQLEEANVPLQIDGEGPAIFIAKKCSEKE